jgi:outer membrane receptor protein involved in Fe transport
MFILLPVSYSQTTGKISGYVRDAESGEPLIGSNIVIEGTMQGASADINGYYFILNIPPGTYRLKATYIGYETTIMKDLVVSVNRTSLIDFRLKPSAIQTKEIVISVPGIQSKKDQTSSIRNITSSEIKMLPVENLDAVVNLQAGVVDGHFRGGRSDEVSYMVDGVKVGESYGNSRTVTVENNVISEIEVITGTFNAEYGDAMSGVVNAVTKDGGNAFHGSASVNSSNYYTSHSDVFFGLKNSDILRSKDVSVFLEGPIVNNLLSFVINARFQDNVGPRNGIRRFMPDNFSDFSSQNSYQWYSEHTGDNAIVPMETNKSSTIFGKIAFKPFQSLRTSVNYSFNSNEGLSSGNGYIGYSYFNKFNPDGLSTLHYNSNLVTLTINHTLSQSIFYEFKSSYLYSYNSDYMFENPNDPRYVHDIYDGGSNGPGFSTGGMSRKWNENWEKDISQKFDLTWQINKNHVIKTGAEYKKLIINRFDTQIRNEYYSTPNVNDVVYDTVTHKLDFPNYKPQLILDPNSIYKDIYNVEPTQLAIYAQDKMEFDEMVINFGIRFDYFNPNTTYPSQLRNPGNQLSFPDNPEKMSVYLPAESSTQISPRFGISYKLGDMALLRFSYGHFFQMPPLYALYSNFDHVIGTSDYKTLLGNPRVKPQKTIQYETGLWMQVSPDMSLEVAVFYRDIYQLLGTEFVQTFNSIEYGLYSNKDYGNARGVELKYDFVSGPFSARVNYTLQYTRGDADSPQFAFNRAGSKLDPVNVLIPMSWDQRHTLNASLSYNSEGYNISLIGRFDSGTPFTWAPLSDSPLALVHLNPNNSTKPSQFSVDATASIDLLKFGSSALRLRVLIYNLLDALNEVGVNNTTGRADQAVVRETDVESYRSNFTTVYDLYKDPSQYSNPRSIKLGVEFSF